MPLPFPFASVNRAITEFFGEGAVANALRDLARAATSGGSSASPLITIIPVSPAQQPFVAAAVQTTMNVYVVDTSVNDMTISTPAAPVVGDAFTVKDKNGFQGLFVTGSGGQLIDGVPTYAMPKTPPSIQPSLQAATFAWDGTEWKVIGFFKGGTSPP